MSQTARPIDYAAIPVIAGYFLAGVVTLATGLPSMVQRSLGHPFDCLWVAFLLLGPITTLTGVALKNQYVGTWVRLGGGLLCAGAAFGFWFSAVDSFGWETTTAWMFGGLMTSSFVVCYLDARTLRTIERRAKKMER